MNEFTHSSEMNIEDLFINVFVLVDDFFQNYFQSSNVFRRGNNHNPKFTDSEVITVQLVGELLSIDSQRAWINMMHKNWRYLFPQLPERSRFGRRLRKMFFVLDLLQRHLCSSTDADLDRHFIVDSFPLKLCHLQRLKSSRCPFEYCATVGYNASKKTYYYGMKVHLATDLRGIPRVIILTPAHVSDIEALEMMTVEIHKSNSSGLIPIVIGDKGYVGKERADHLLDEHQIHLIPIARNYDKQLGESGLTIMIRKTRKIIETTISILTDQFNMAKTRTRSVLGLQTSIMAKAVAMASCCLMNLTNNESVLQVKQIVF